MNGWDVRHDRDEITGSQALTVFGLLVALFVGPAFTDADAAQRATSAQDVLEMGQVAINLHAKEVLVLDTAADDLRICPVQTFRSPRVGCITAKQLRERAK